MHVMVVAVVLLAVAIIVANSYTTWLLVSEDTLEPVQKYCQTAIIWLLPLIGAVIVYSFVLSDRADSKFSHRSTNDTSITDGDGFDLSRSHSSEFVDGD